MRKFYLYTFFTMLISLLSAQPNSSLVIFREASWFKNYGHGEYPITQFYSDGLTDPQKNYYTFKGWSLDGTNVVNEIVVDGNITLHAVWEANEIIVDESKLKLNYQEGEDIDYDLIEIIDPSDNSGPKVFTMDPQNGITIENNKLRASRLSANIYEPSVLIESSNGASEKIILQITIIKKSLPPSPPPSPNPSFSITIPSLNEIEGLTFDPSFEDGIYVRLGGSFDFNMIIDPEYSESEPELLVNGNLLEPYQSSLRSSMVYSYRITNIRTDITIEVRGIKKNEESTVDNAEIDDDKLIVRTHLGQLQLETAKEMLVIVRNIKGQTLFNRTLNGMTAIDLPAGVYIVTTEKEKLKVFVRSRE